MVLPRRFLGPLSGADLPAWIQFTKPAMNKPMSQVCVTPSLAQLQCLAPAVCVPPAKLDPQMGLFLTKGNCLEELLSSLVFLIPGITAVTSTVTICSKTNTLVPFKCSNHNDLQSLGSLFIFYV